MPNVFGREEVVNSFDTNAVKLSVWSKMYLLITSQSYFVLHQRDNASHTPLCWISQHADNTANTTNPSWKWSMLQTNTAENLMKKKYRK